jgi:uncharacterized membrane protein
VPAAAGSSDSKERARSLRSRVVALLRRSLRRSGGRVRRRLSELDQALVYYRRFLAEASPDERAPLAEETRSYVHEIEAEKAQRQSLTDKADREEAAEVTPPAATPSPATPPRATPASATSPPPAPAVVQSAVAATAPAPEPTRRHRSLAERWWVWTAAGAVAVGLAVGLGVGLGSRANDPSTALGTRSPSF